ncbi:hypothetical protein MNBD_GAMMA22-1061 [hydrothermal vent metagenome]|uniref:Uncharacterized protein n=1 Tax=hydrothermal vent metagenome TaxID=652676 RepID=A0A3B1A7C1_9ZZZZ
MLNYLIKLFFLVSTISLLACSATVVQKNTIYPQTQPIPDNARAQFNRALWAAKSMLLDEAIVLFNELSRDYPQFARSYTNLGLLYLTKNELTAAERALLHAVAIYPYDAIAQNHLGIVLRKLGKFKQAEQAYLAAVKYNDEYNEAVLNLGVLYDLYLHDTSKALFYYKQSQSLLANPDSLVQKWIIDIQRRVKKDLDVDTDLAVK